MIGYGQEIPKAEEDEMTDRPTIAVLGTGIMGAPIAINLLRHGFTVRVWNRTAAKAAPLVDEGAVLADSPALAADGADFVLTMLADGDVVRSVMTGESGALAAMRPAAVWLQASTVGTEATDLLAGLAAEAGIAFVDCPVLGTRQPAEERKLVILEGGPAELSERIRPVFDAIGRTVLRVGDVGAASRLKLVLNTWVLAVTNGTAECVALARTLGVDPALFLEAISGGTLDCQYAHLKGNQMINGDYPASFPVGLAAKDARLILAAAADRVDLGGAAAMLTHLERAERRGHGEDDMAAAYEGCRPD